MPNPFEARALMGVEGLDEVLHGGLIRGRVYLLDGNPGAGKTTLALQYLLKGVSGGEKCLYVTLSETTEELAAGARSHGLSVDGTEVLELLVSEDELDGEGDLTMYHPGEIELTRTTQRILEAVDRIKPDRMVLDSLSEVRLLAQSSLRYRRQVLALKQFFIGRRCTALLLDDRTAEASDMQLQSVAHGVISLERRAPAYGRLRRQVQVQKFRGSDFHSGFHDFVIRRGGLEVFPRLTAAEHGIDFERTPIVSGVTLLDSLLGGGVDRGTATLLVGPPGTGKSTVAVQYAAAATDRGDHAAIFAFDESRSMLLARSQGIGRTIHEGTGPGQMRIRQIDPTEVSPGEFAQMVRRSVQVDHARVVVIDSLNGYLNAMPEDRVLSTQLHELLSFLNNEGVATFLVVSQSGLMGAGMGAPIDASYLADAVVMLRMFEHEGKVKKAISVLKKRSGRHEAAIRELWLDAEGIHLSEPLVHLRGVLTGVPVDRGDNSGMGRHLA